MPSSLNRGDTASRVTTALLADAVARCLQERFGDLAEQMTVRRIKQGTAYVQCSSSVLAEEIRLAEPNLLQEITERAGSDHVERIVATV